MMSMTIQTKAWAVACMIAVVAGILGCRKSDGLNRVEVSGTVTFDGAPLETGSIALIPEEGTAGPSVGGPIQAGKFQLTAAEGPVAGKYKIMIRASRKTGRQIEAGEGADDPTAMVDEIEMFIPEKYNSKTELTAEIGPSTGPLAFDLKSEGGEGN